MKNYYEEIKNRLDSEEKYRERLFCRSYLITNAKIDFHNQYPFYDIWNTYKIGDFSIFVHPLTNCFVKSSKNEHMVLIGHAYNPFTKDINENDIIEKLFVSYNKNYSTFLDMVDELTGVFVLFIFKENEVLALQDCGGQKMLYFGIIENNIVFSSVPQLVGDIFKLKVDPNIVRLLNSKGYYRGSGFLPGNKSPYKELKRLGPNTLVKYRDSNFEIERFFPRRNNKPIINENEKNNAIKKMQEVFSTNIDLTMKKWQRVGLSLTGGVDSKTTFANAKKWYGKFHCFSFISKESEREDAYAARELCRKVNINHSIYLIPDDESEIDDYDFLQKIIEHSTSYLCKLHANEKRKYIFLERLNDFDVEIKSDISEIGRAYTNRKYYKVKMPNKLTPRHLTIGQARYFFEPWAMKYSDNAYRQFMNETNLLGDLFGYSMHDLSYWEVRMGAWASTSFASQEYFHEITIPYNNRKLMTMFLQFPYEDRACDLPHMRLMRSGNSIIADSDNSVKDSYFGNKRMMIETLYYYYATFFNRSRFYKR